MNELGALADTVPCAEIVEHALRERAVAGLTRITEIDLDQGSTLPTGANTTGSGMPSKGPSTQLPGSSAPAAAAAATSGAVRAPGFFGSQQQADGTSEGDGLREGGRLSIDDVEEGEDTGKVVKSFEIHGSMVSE